MAKPRPPIHAGLAGLVAEVARESAGSAARRSAPLDDLVPGPFQPRRRFDPSALERLAESVREHGVLQPLVVRDLGGGRLEVVAGERRLRAARLAGLREVPVEVHALSDAQAALIAAAENLQREDLSAIDEIDATITLVANTLGVPVAAAPARLSRLDHRPDAEPETVAALERLFAQLGRGTWRSFTRNKLRVLRWPDEVLDAMRREGLGFTLAGIVAVAPAAHRAALLRRALEGATAQALREEARALAASALTGDSAEPLAERAPRVARLLARRRRLAALDAERAERVSALLNELEGLLDAPGPTRRRRKS